jgi:hypothetical protein
LEPRVGDTYVRSRQVTFILKALVSPIDIKKVKIPGDI